MRTTRRGAPVGLAGLIFALGLTWSNFVLSAFLASGTPRMAEAKEICHLFQLASVQRQGEGNNRIGLAETNPHASHCMRKRGSCDGGLPHYLRHAGRCFNPSAHMRTLIVRLRLARCSGLASVLVLFVACDTK